MPGDPNFFLRMEIKEGVKLLTDVIRGDNSNQSTAEALSLFLQETGGWPDKLIVADVLHLTRSRGHSSEDEFRTVLTVIESSAAMSNRKMLNINASEALGKTNLTVCTEAKTVNSGRQQN